MLRALPKREARIAAQIEGRVTDLRVRRGDTVRAGQRVATLYNADLAASAQEARAARQAAQRESRQARAGAAFDRGSQTAQVRGAEAARRGEALPTARDGGRDPAAAHAGGQASVGVIRRRRGVDDVQGSVNAAQQVLDARVKERGQFGADLPVAS